MDKMVTAYRDAVQNNYVNFSGRLSVPGYWWFALANFIIGLILQILGEATSLFAVLSVLYSLAVLLPNLGAGARRLHDTGKSAWFLLLALIPILGWIALIVLLAGKGDEAMNEYGPPPPPMVTA